MKLYAQFKSKIYIVAICFAIGVCAGLLPFVYTQFVIRTQLTRLTDKFHEGMISRDETVLRSILANEIILDTPYEKSNLSKDALLSRIRINSTSANSLLVSELSVSVGETISEVVCTQDLIFDIENGRSVEHNGKYTYFYQKIGSEWKIFYIRQEN